MPPTGRIRKPTPNVAVVSSSWPYPEAAGKNSGPITSIRNVKTVKSKNSSALPMVVPAITRRRMALECKSCRPGAAAMAIDMFSP